MSWMPRVQHWKEAAWRQILLLKWVLIASLFYILVVVILAGVPKAHSGEACADEVDNVGEVVAKITAAAAGFEGIRFRIVQREANGITMIGVFYAGWPVSPVYFFMHRCLISQNLNMPALRLAPFMTGKEVDELFPRETPI